MKIILILVTLWFSLSGFDSNSTIENTLDKIVQGTTISKSISLSTDYRLFGLSMNDKEKSFQSNVYLKNNGFYAGIHVNSRYQGEDTLQIWLISGYSLKVTDKLSWSNHYVRDIHRQDQSLTIDIWETFVNSSYFGVDFMLFHNFNLSTRQSNAEYVRFARIGKSYNKVYIQAEGGRVINYSDYFQSTISYKYNINGNNNKVYITAGKNTFKNDTTKDNYLLIGVTFNF